MDANTFIEFWKNGQLSGLTLFSLTREELIDLMEKYNAYVVGQNF